MVNTSAVEIESITVSFDGKPVVRDFSLSLSWGEKAVLAGRSGSGKTTILRSILGFVVPEKGRIRIGGELLTDDSVWELRKRIAYVAQEPDLGRGSVREVIELPFTYRSNSHLRGNLSRLPGLFEELFLPISLLEKDISKLSGGEKQRVAIISALLLDRRILLLDEICSSLDKGSMQAVVDLLGKDDRLTILWVSHVMTEGPVFGRTVELPGGSMEGRP